MKNSILLAAIFCSAVLSSAAQADVVVGPSILNFTATVSGGISPEQYIYIENQDPKNSVTGLEVSVGECQTNYDFSTDCTENLGPAQSCDIFVTFRPMTQGFSECIVSIAATSEQGQANVTLMGQANAI